LRGNIAEHRPPACGQRLAHRGIGALPDQREHGQQADPLDDREDQEQPPIAGVQIACGRCHQVEIAAGLRGLQIAHLGQGHGDTGIGQEEEDPGDDRQQPQVARQQSRGVLPGGIEVEFHAALLPFAP